MEKRAYLGTIAAGLLAACGGGGDGVGPIQPPVKDLETVTYGYSNFTAVSIGGSFDLTLRQRTSSWPGRSATLNLMDNATVTGSLNNASALFYYGTGINMLLNVDSTSTVTRLGAQR